MYENPAMEVIEFFIKDVVCTSVNGGETTDGNGGSALAPDEW